MLQGPRAGPGGGCGHRTARLALLVTLQARRRVFLHCRAAWSGRPGQDAAWAHLHKGPPLAEMPLLQSALQSTSWQSLLRHS